MPNKNPKKNVGLAPECECGTPVTLLTCEYQNNVKKEATLLHDNFDVENFSSQEDEFWQCPVCGKIHVDTTGLFEEETEEILEAYMKTGVLPDECNPCE